MMSRPAKSRARAIATPDTRRPPALILALLGMLLACAAVVSLTWSSPASAQDAAQGAAELDEEARGEAADPKRSSAVAAVRQNKGKGRKVAATASRYGWLRIYTNYDAQVTVDGQPYPKRSEYGMKLDAHERHDVVVKMGDKQKNYVVVVKPKELRTLMVDLTGYNTPPTPEAKAPTPARASANQDEKKEDDANEESGKLTVYSKPRGEVFVDGAALGVSTPMINRELDIGRHEVQVKWESGEMSETKTIRIRKGSKLKLFFRDRTNNVGKR